MNGKLQAAVTANAKVREKLIMLGSALRVCAAQQGLRPSNSPRELAEALGLTKNSRLTMGQWQEVCVHIVDRFGPADMQTVFEALDVGGKGYIELKDFVFVMSCIASSDFTSSAVEDPVVQITL